MPAPPFPQPEQTGFDFAAVKAAVPVAVPAAVPVAVPTPGSERLAERDGFAGRELTVTSLHTELKRALNSLGVVRVAGEVHGVKQYPGGGTFLTLKDRAAQISVRVPPNRERWCRSVQGESVIVTGRMETFTRNGSLTLTASSIEPVGAGAVAAMIVQIRDRLRAEGILDRPRRPLPTFPKKVGLVCGNDAAVLHDIRSVLERRFVGFPLVVVEVSQSSPESIIEGLEAIVRDPEVEVVILARGGGDATQLLPYSNEFLCRAVALCRVPVVSAIGHEIDRPLCDEVSDARAATPSVAASMVIPDRAGLEGRLSEARARSWAALVRLTERARTRSEFAGHAVRVGPGQQLISARGALDAIRWEGTLDRRIESNRRDLSRGIPVGPVLHPLRQRLESVRAQIESLSPEQVLTRGFAVVRTSSGAVVRSPDSVRVGDRLVVKVADGTIDVTVVSSAAHNVEP
jgi:exodeoxyribonuclease VII large subunit